MSRMRSNAAWLDQRGGYVRVQCTEISGEAMPSRHVRQGSLDGERDDERAMLHRDAGRPAGKELVAQSVDARAAHVGVVQLVFQSRFVTPVEISLWENTETMRPATASSAGKSSAPSQIAVTIDPSPCR